MSAQNNAPMVHDVSEGGLTSAEKWMAACDIAAGMQAYDQAENPELDQICNLLMMEQASVMVVGQVKVGKSMFVNGLTGRGGGLPSDVNPLTTVVTHLHFNMPLCQTAGGDFHFYEEEDWQRLATRGAGDVSGEASTHRDVMLHAQIEGMKMRAEQKLGVNYRDFFGQTHRFDTVDTAILEQYICSESGRHGIDRHDQYDDLVRVADVYFDTSPFPLPITITDTPGVNDPLLIRDEITWQTIGNADYYLVILSAHQAMSKMDETLMRALQENGSGRAIVFINRIDELSNCTEDAALLRTTVREGIRRIFGGPPSAVLAGSALWAHYAATGDDTDIDHDQVMSWINGNPALKARLTADISAKKHHKGKDKVEREDILRHRALIASGMPELRRFLSSIAAQKLSSLDVSAEIFALHQLAQATETEAKMRIEELQNSNVSTLTPAEVLEILDSASQDGLGLISMKVGDSCRRLVAELEVLKTDDVIGLDEVSEADAELPPQLAKLRAAFHVGIQEIKREIVTELAGLQAEFLKICDENASAVSRDKRRMDMNLVHQFKPDASVLWREASAAEAQGWVRRVFQRGSPQHWSQKQIAAMSDIMVSAAQSALLSRADAVSKHYTASISGCLYDENRDAVLTETAGDTFTGNSSSQAAHERLRQAEHFVGSLKRLMGASINNEQELGNNA
ncbi:dynamin family protein [Halocynthiibacter namhaensis]|uniref:dynamin family protein n=1 Tax=Halocynthiibacter namhaensis TaxID=1290553 RepID=UPI000AA32FB2|nr:dynamin family protein [Halocynthiibacter namhaensis]